MSSGLLSLVSNPYVWVFTFIFFIHIAIIVYLLIKKNALPIILVRSSLILSTLQWIVVIPLSLLFGLGIAMTPSSSTSSGNENLGVFLIIMTVGILPAVCVYAINNMWGNHKKQEYSRAIYYSLVPYVIVILSSVLYFIYI